MTTKLNCSIFDCRWLSTFYPQYTAICIGCVWSNAYDRWNWLSASNYQIFAIPASTVCFSCTPFDTLLEMSERIRCCQFFAIMKHEHPYSSSELLNWMLCRLRIKTEFEGNLSINSWFQQVNSQANKTNWRLIPTLECKRGKNAKSSFHTILTV